MVWRLGVGGSKERDEDKLPPADVFWSFFSPKSSVPLLDIRSA